MPVKRSTGFTLIELSVVLFIIVLGFMAVGVNIASGTRSTQMQAASRDLVSALRYARGHALLSHQTIAVAVDLSNNSYRISNRDKSYQLPEELALTLVIAEDEFVGDEIAQIRFYPDGSSSGGRITLEWGDLQRRIDVNWLSGKVEISDGQDAE